MSKKNKSISHTSREIKERLKHQSENPKDLSFKKDWLIGICLLFATVIAYQPVWDGSPVWDDNKHITTPEMSSIEGLTRIWTKVGATQQYYPFVHTVFWIEHHIWGNNPFGYHFVNILLHFISVLFLVRILRFLQIPGAWLTGALFALHPVQVESVAWISELKNTLSGTFYLSAALIYLLFERDRKKGNYIIGFALFIIGLISKSVIATLPVAILVVIWWRNGKINWKHDILPLLPFFAAGIVSGLFTGWVERKYVGAEGITFNITFIERCLVAGRAVLFYLSKLCFPINLTFIYPRWNVSQTIWWQYLFPVATIMLTTVLWSIRKWSRAPLAVLIYFFATLFPALGFFNVYPFRYSFVADHFQYLALIGPITLLSAKTCTLYLKNNALNRRITAMTVIGILLSILGFLTFKQCEMYTDAETLYRATIKKNPSCWLANNNIGVLMANKGRPFEAIDYYSKALESNTNYAEAQNNLGNALSQTGQLDLATIHLKKALEINPNYAEAQNNIGIVLEKTGQINEAIEHYRKALEIRPNFAEALNNLGNAVSRAGQMDVAISNYQKALVINPNYAEAHINLGVLFERSQRYDEALQEFEMALKINPQQWEIHYNIGILLMKSGKIENAIPYFLKVVEINPAFAEAWSNLGNAMLKTGQIDNAISYYQKTLEINPNKINTLINLGSALSQKGQSMDAIQYLQRALALAKSAGDEEKAREINENINKIGSK